MDERTAAHTDPAEEADLFLGPFEDESPAASAPLTVGELAAKLAEFPPDATVYVSIVGGNAAKPTRVRWGNEYNPKGEYVTVDNG